MKQLGLSFDIQFCIGMFSVQLNGLHADRKSRGNRFAAVAEQYLANNLALSLGKQVLSKAIEGG